MRVDELPTPALVVDLAILDANLAVMAAALPGPRLRPHVKAHKCTTLAARQVDLGHTNLTCATVGEVVGLARAGLGHDLLLANETLDARRLGQVAETTGARITVAIDSPETIAAAADGGVGEVLIDVDVGLPRCGCDPAEAGRLAEVARSRGLVVRGVMGYEGHATAMAETSDRAEAVEASMVLLRATSTEVGGDVVSSGSTVTYEHNRGSTEIQAGSYALMDTYFQAMVPQFRPALAVLATVISRSSKGWVVADAGLKALGMDHGPPRVDGGDVFIVSDEHTTFIPGEDALPMALGARIRIWPAHIDPTVAYHDRFHIVEDGEVVDEWPIDLRGW